MVTWLPVYMYIHMYMRRGRSEGATVGGGISKKKNARAKERVLNVRQRYEELSVVLGARVGGGRGGSRQCHAFASFTG